MDRKDFLRGLGLVGLGALTIPAIKACSSGDDDSSSSSSASDTTQATDTGGTSSSDTCSVTATETEGPFPTKTPGSLVTSNIVSDRTGVGFKINIYIKNTKANCAALAGAIVDIWHCDKDGYYSEYGGTSMQSANFTTVHFLRGRQTTDANGLVQFTSIFPGWYSGRATHIHVHIYNASGTSLLVTQIAFPEGSGSAVALVNASSANGYTKGLSGYTYNSTDNVFSDGVSNEMSTVTGSVAEGFVLTHTINVAS
ncbi:intradiol ring-cleavage dioxygenase [Flavobacterium aquiphilum]|uniref:dioxygenase family protein n=1 Tax=Flavobacterium aquiphilum TaxID=3003261 RepID=UPI00247FF4B7|nr:intradiol ring-cleavage dioxygenase [Flavobacterium aquiphilum]